LVLGFLIYTFLVLVDLASQVLVPNFYFYHVLILEIEIKERSYQKKVRGERVFWIAIF
jgi:hypothetical protein